MTDIVQPTTKGDENHLKEVGFRWGPKGAHTSRTIMLDELRAVMSNCRPEASRNDYLSAIYKDNCLEKRTTATRKLSGQRLSELYALAPEVPLFRIMRRCWYTDPEGCTHSEPPIQGARHSCTKEKKRLFAKKIPQFLERNIFS